MRNIFYYVTYLICYIGVISIAHIILLQARSQEFLRAGQAFANQGTSFQQLIGTKLHENLQITLVNILTLLCNLMIQRITKNINDFATRKNAIFYCYIIFRGKKIYFQEPDVSSAQLYLRACSNMQNTGAQNLSVRPIETQLETLIFVSHYLNRLAAFILNMFLSKIFTMMLLQSEC